MLFSQSKALELLDKQLSEYTFGSHPADLYEPIKYILNLGGKRLRPLLALSSAYLFSDDWEKAVKPALAVEVFHNFTLMHDDIMDKAPLRRGKETVHKKWDSNTAILSGDVMLVKAYELLLYAESGNLKKIIEAFNKAAAEVCEGQKLDMNFETLDKVSIDEYIAMISLKTAALLGFSLKLGALITNAKDNEVENLNKFGLNMGIAFQLMDDLLDVYGDQSKFGKQVGGDITSNKKTFLYITAFEKASGENLKKLQAAYSSNDKNKVEKVKEIYDSLGIKNYTEDKMNHYFQLALNHLHKVNAPLNRKHFLQDFAEKLMKRDH
ncbi:MAG: polyprenyl synthetase family protein [Cytophagaceae bacterium]